MPAAVASEDEATVSVLELLLLQPPRTPANATPSAPAAEPRRKSLLDTLDMVDLLSKLAGKIVCISQNYSTKIVIKIRKKPKFAKLERCAT
jgi:hypothetical protein